MMCIGDVIGNIPVYAARAPRKRGACAVTTIADVARRANVSRMTVSRVVNNSPKVHPATRQRVLEAIEALDYRPNMVAKGLATGRSGLIAYVVPDISVMFYGQISKGVENACFERGRMALLYEVGSLQRLEDCMDMLISRHIEGAIFHDVNLRSDHLARLRAAGVRCVTVDNETELEGCPCVDSDNRGGGRLAGEHLVALGHRNIACMTGMLGQVRPEMASVDGYQRRVWQERTRGFVESLQAAGLEPAFFVEGSASLDDGFNVAQAHMRRILAMENPPTALYCENDIMALGAVSTLLEHGIPFPQRMAVIGHDGLEICLRLYPHVSTVVQPRYEIGRSSAHMLLDLIEGSCRQTRLRLPSHVFRGDTT